MISARFRTMPQIRISDKAFPLQATFGTPLPNEYQWARDLWRVPRRPRRAERVGPLYYFIAARESSVRVSINFERTTRRWA